MALNQQKLLTELRKLDNKRLQKLSLHLYETIPSTNQILWELLDRNLKPPLVAIATQQTAGRGQWGRQWQSHSGGLYLSVAIDLNIPTHKAAHLTLLSAWGIAEALRRQEIPVKIKWLNDILLERRKLGGIKCETRVQQKIVTQAVIGVGLNWTNPVPQMGINLETYLDKVTTLERLAAIAIYGIFLGYERYLTNGIEDLLSSYLTLSESIGRKVTVNGSPGVVIGVNCQGDLRVRLHSPGATTEIDLPSGTISLGYEE